MKVESVSKIIVYIQNPNRTILEHEICEKETILEIKNCTYPCVNTNSSTFEQHFEETVF